MKWTQPLRPDMLLFPPSTAALFPNEWSHRYYYYPFFTALHTQTVTPTKPAHNHTAKRIQVILSSSGHRITVALPSFSKAPLSRSKRQLVPGCALSLLCSGTATIEQPPPHLHLS